MTQRGTECEKDTAWEQRHRERGLVRVRKHQREARIARIKQQRGTE